jgi:uncharacterized protein (DUF2461 family)
MNSEKTLRQLRRAIFDYPPEIEAKADRVLLKLKARVLKQRENAIKNAPRGPYSGLTRRELVASGTCEPDWY